MNKEAKAQYMDTLRERYFKRKYDRAKTPYLRLLESDQFSKKDKEKLTALYQSLNPAWLKRAIDKKLSGLYALYQKKNSKEVINVTKKLTPSLVSFSRVEKEQVLVS